MQISPNQYKQRFILSELAEDIRQQLQTMQADPAYNTQVSYSPSDEDGVTFEAKHFGYISTHPAVKPLEYLSNLRLMTKIRKY